MAEPLSRREALGAGLAVAAAVALGAPAAAAAAPDQGSALTALVRAELDAAFVYREAGLPGAAATLAGHDDDHARALAAHLQAIGMPLPAPTRSRERLGRAAVDVLEAIGDEQRLRAAAAFERALVAGAAEQLARLEAPGTIRTAATVMASHAQHLALHERALSSRS